MASNVVLNELISKQCCGKMYFTVVNTANCDLAVTLEVIWHRGSLHNCKELSCTIPFWIIYTPVTIRKNLIGEYRPDIPDLSRGWLFFGFRKDFSQFVYSRGVVFYSPFIRHELFDCERIDSAIRICTFYIFLGRVL